MSNSELINGNLALRERRYAAATLHYWNGVIGKSDLNRIFIFNIRYVKRIYQKGLLNNKKAAFCVLDLNDFKKSNYSGVAIDFFEPKVICLSSIFKKSKTKNNQESNVKMDSLEELICFVMANDFGLVFFDRVSRETSIFASLYKIIWGATIVYSENCVAPESDTSIRNKFLLPSIFDHELNSDGQIFPINVIDENIDQNSNVVLNKDGEAWGRVSSNDLEIENLFQKLVNFEIVDFDIFNKLYGCYSDNPNFIDISCYENDLNKLLSFDRWIDCDGLQVKLIKPKIFYEIIKCINNIRKLNGVIAEKYHYKLASVIFKNSGFPSPKDRAKFNHEIHLAYVAGSHMPTYAANNVHVFKMCNAFANTGIDTSLHFVLADECESINKPLLFEKYGVTNDYHLVPYSSNNGDIVAHFEIISKIAVNPRAVVFTRSVIAAYAAGLLGIPFVIERHAPAKQKDELIIYEIFKMRSFRSLVVITEALKTWFVDFYRLDPKSIVVLPDGADRICVSRNNFELIDANKYRFKVGYSGHLYQGRGIDLILLMAKNMPDTSFHILGGRSEDVDYWLTQSKEIKNIYFYGHRPHSDVSLFLMAVDILIAPYQKVVRVYGGKPEDDTSKWMSPLKVFEYMASGKPLITSNLPVLFEVLKNKRNALLCEPDVVEEWIDAINFLKNNPAYAQLIASQAKYDFECKYTWDSRAKRSLTLYSDEVLFDQEFNSKRKEKIVVYSCLFGDYEELKEPDVADPNVEYIIFTDNKDLVSKKWRIVVIENLSDNVRKASRLPKILPHKYLSDHDISIYVDASFYIMASDIVEMAIECLDGKDIALYEHKNRVCTYDEIRHVRSDPTRKVDGDICDRHLEKLETEGFPEKYGLFENGLIVRRNTEQIKQLNELWWSEYKNGAERDQFSFMYCVWKLGVDVNSISVGHEIRKNPYVKFNAHEYRVSPINPLLSNKWENNANKKLVLLADYKMKNTQRVFIVYSQKHAGTGTTRMRNFQLVNILRSYFKGINIESIDTKEARSVKNSIIILDKNSARGVPLQDLDIYKYNKNFVLFDYVDLQFSKYRVDAIDLVDGFIAASVQQYNYLKSLYQNKLVHLITHHVDPRVTSSEKNGKHCSIGFFGEMENAIYAEDLTGIVDFIPIATNNDAGNSWLDCIGSYDAHYSVRSTKFNSIDRHKPFLKGFTAAKCGAPIITHFDENDVLYYLGGDYPYFVRDGSLSDVREIILKMLDDFGTKEWDFAVDIMRSVESKSSNLFIANQFYSLLKSI